MSVKKVIGLEEGLGVLAAGFAKASRIVDGDPGVRFTTDELMTLYECSYRMCTQIPDYTANVYQWYKEALEQCVATKVLPPLMDKNGEVLLQELLKLRTHYENMIKLLSISFQYMDRYYIVRQNIPSVRDVANHCFCNLVFSALNDRIKDTVINMIVRESEGQQVDLHLLGSTVSLIHNSDGQIQYFYQKEFEQVILQYARAFYSQKVSEWISEYSLSDYLLQIEECLKRENERLSRYIISGPTRKKLLQVIKDQLMSVCENQLKGMGINDPYSLQRYLDTNQELGLRCANLTINEGSLGAVPFMNVDS